MKKITCVGLCLVPMLLSLTGGCGDDKPSGPILGDFAYPLQVGQVWKYSGRQYSFNFRPDSISGYSLLSNWVSTVQVVQKTKLFDTLEVYSFKETAIENGINTFQSWNYFDNRPDGFYRYAYGGTSPMMQPRKIAPTQYQLIFRGRPLDDFAKLIGASLSNPSGPAPQVDSITNIEDPPFRCLRYPLTAGSEWPVRVPAGIVPISKKAIDRVRIQIPAGIYTCARIQWLWDVDEDGSWDTDIEQYDYISVIGLVKRTLVFHDVTFATPEHPLGIGICDFGEVWELTQTQGGQ